jgi:hypothetical protein
LNHNKKEEENKNLKSNKNNKEHPKLNIINNENSNKDKSKKNN